MTCGYAVDWVRSCYGSTWRLFRNDGRKTRGRFYYATPGTPHYPGWHLLGSRIWTSDERDPEPAQGETNDPWWLTYSKGKLPVPQPAALALGSADCIAAGETVSLPLVPRQFIHGIDARCWPVDPPWLSEVCACSSIRCQVVVNRFGLEIGGSAYPPSTFLLVASGGIMLDGFTHWRLEADGGLDVGGEAAIVSGPLLAASGGLDLDGSAEMTRHFFLEASGGILISGNAHGDMPPYLEYFGTVCACSDDTEAHTSFPFETNICACSTITSSNNRPTGTACGCSSPASSTNAWTPGTACACSDISSSHNRPTGTACACSSITSEVS